MQPFLEAGLRRWVALRARWRGLALPIFALPLPPALLVAVLGNEGRAAMGCLLGLGATALATRVLMRGRRGDTRRAAFLMAAGTGAVAGMAAHMHQPLPILMAAGAFFGVRLMYAELPEVAPPPPPAPSPPPPGPIEQWAARVERLKSAAAWLQDAKLTAAATAMGHVVADLKARPERLALARRFLTVHLDGLDRIAQRLEGGATPPASLDPLLEELTRAAAELRERVRREESEQLEIQVKVLADRLKQEGFA